MKPLRIALLGAASSIHLQRWAQALVERGHAVCVISQHRVPPRQLPASVQVHWLPHTGAAAYVTNAWALRQYLHRWQPQILNAHYASGYGTTAMLARFKPSVLSVWGSDVQSFAIQNKFKRWLVCKNLRSATTVAVTSQALFDQVRHLTPERQAIAITPFGVDLEQFFIKSTEPLSTSKNAKNLQKRPFTLGLVKALAPVYGIDLLLRAFAQLCADTQVRTVQPELQLLIVGEGQQRAQLQQLATDLQIAHQVRFVGAVAHHQVPHWLHQFDVYVAPSRAESFGVAIIEALACGLPVVASAIGGLPEVVRHNQTGLLVPANQVPALFLALKRLILEPTLRQRLGQTGHQHVAQHYHWSTCVQRMEQCYEQTLRL
jgi:L-malate glycosyltransferase